MTATTLAVCTRGVVERSAYFARSPPGTQHVWQQRMRGEAQVSRQAPGSSGTTNPPRHPAPINARPHLRPVLGLQWGVVVQHLGAEHLWGRGGAHRHESAYQGPQHFGTCIISSPNNMVSIPAPALFVGPPIYSALPPILHKDICPRNCIRYTRIFAESKV